MNKIIIFVFILFQLNGFSQVELGQSSSQTLYLLNHFIKEHPNWEMEKVYDQGELKEVTIYQYGQLFQDLLIKADAIQRFVMKDGVYALNILQFPSLTLEQLQTKYHSYYKNSRIGDYYFDEDFEYQRTIELVDETASILYQKTIFDELPITVQQKIEHKGIPQDKVTLNDNKSYTNPLEKSLRDSFNICGDTKILQVSLRQFDDSSEYDYPTSSHRTVFCDKNKEIVLDYLIEEGVDGFYYFTFSEMSFKEVVEMVFETYNLRFDMNDIELQKMEGKDSKSYVVMEQQNVNDNRTMEIKSYYNGSLAGDYIRITQTHDGKVQVHIAYNGLL